MPRGTTLANALLMLKAELGYSLTAGVATADDQQLYRLIDSEQKRLAADFDWPFLDKFSDVVVNQGVRNPSLPTDIVFERPILVTRAFNGLWQEIEHGITDEDYNITDTDAGETQDPIRRWKMNSDGTTFEVWPVGDSAQTIRFRGQRPIGTLQTAGAYDGAKLLDLDDLLIVLFVAANRLLRMKQQDGQIMLQRAENRLRMLRMGYVPIVKRMTTIGPACDCDCGSKRHRGLVVVGASDRLLGAEGGGVIGLE